MSLTVSRELLLAKMKKRYYGNPTIAEVYSDFIALTGVLLNSEVWLLQEYSELMKDFHCQFNGHFKMSVGTTGDVITLLFFRLLRQVSTGLPTYRRACRTLQQCTIFTSRMSSRSR